MSFRYPFSRDLFSSVESSSPLPAKTCNLLSCTGGQRRPISAVTSNDRTRTTRVLYPRTSHITRSTPESLIDGTRARKTGIHASRLSVWRLRNVSSTPCSSSGWTEAQTTRWFNVLSKSRATPKSQASRAQEKKGNERVVWWAPRLVAYRQKCKDKQVGNPKQGYLYTFILRNIPKKAHTHLWYSYRVYLVFEAPWLWHGSWNQCPA